MVHIGTTPQRADTYNPPVASIVSLVTKSASDNARKQITFAWSSGLGDAPQRRALDLRRLVLRRLLVPAWPDALGQRAARRGLVDGVPNGPSSSLTRPRRPRC